MDSDTVKQDIVGRLDELPPEALREVRDFIGVLQRQSSSASVFEDIDASIDAVPDTEWEDIPDDASARLDDYLYRSAES
jgi:hypothetical protein